MPRQKLSEHRAKTILYDALGLPYTGLSIDASKPLQPRFASLAKNTMYAVKVDQAVKGRFKKGLVILDVPVSKLSQVIKELLPKGYRHYIIEPMVMHMPADERYLSMQYDRQGLFMQYAASGGINIEQHAEAVERTYLDQHVNWEVLSTKTGISASKLKRLAETFIHNYFTFLEINPYIACDDRLQLLDAAVEVDDAAAYFVDSWTNADFRRSGLGATLQERTVEELAAKSPASFKLDVLEPNGSIFLLLSGGGASIVVADEVHARGYGKQLANYGEYSGNPNTEETYIYTKAVLELLLTSQAPHKVLFIGGAVANFTDIAKTFAGVIQAIEDVADIMQRQHIKIFVRRGGPNQTLGLERMQAILAKYGLLGAVRDPDTPLTTAVAEALTKVARHA